MDLTFDFALDGSAWSGPPTTWDATHGERGLGPLDLPKAPPGLGGIEGAFDCACCLSANSAERGGWWLGLYEVDSLGAARRLPTPRDNLRLGGRTGQSVVALHGKFVDLLAEVEDLHGKWA